MYLGEMQLHMVNYIMEIMQLCFISFSFVFSIAKRS